MRWLRLAVVAALVPLLAAPGIPRRRVAAAAGGGDAAIGNSVHAACGFTASCATANIVTTAGSALVCGVTWSPAQAFSSFASSPVCPGAGWVQIGAEQTISNNDARFYYCPNYTGSATTGFTLTLTAAANALGVACVELQGVDTSSVLDQSGYSSDASSPFADPNPSITTTTANSVLVAFTTVDDASIAAMSFGNSFVKQQEEDGTNTMPFAIATRIVSSTGTYNTTYTRTGTNDTSTFLANFKDTSP